MKLVTTITAAALAALALAACGSNDKVTADPTISPSPSTVVKHNPPSRSASSAPAPSLSASGAVATTVDPCQLVPQDEASSLAHASFGPGKEEGTKLRHECVYGAQTPNVLTVFVVQAASPDQAQAGWNTLLAEAQQFAGQAAGRVQLTADSSIGDRAEWVELDLSQLGVSARGLAFLKGATGVYVIDLVRGGAAPSRPDLTDEANTVIGRLP